MEYAFALVDRANILADMNEIERYQKAIENQEEAISILVEESYPKPEEVAELIVWLSSPKAAFITGTHVPIDGGYVAQ